VCVCVSSRKQMSSHIFKRSHRKKNPEKQRTQQE
jgi:hypothetical protein